MKRESLQDIRSLDAACQFMVENGPFNRPDLRVAVVGGSRHNQTFGNQSDLDLITVMKSDHPARVDIDSMLEMGTELNRMSNALHAQTDISPIIVATLRLEEAQIAAARDRHPSKLILPIHWIHFPSLEFMAANESIRLARGLLNGRSLIGDAEAEKEHLKALAETPVKQVRGVDWLTDGLRILIANRDLGERTARVKQDFLKCNASHNLHYFWKWRMVEPLVQAATGREIDDWAEIANVADDLQPDLMRDFRKIHELRHLGEQGEFDEILDLHRLTFSLLPELWK